MRYNNISTFNEDTMENKFGTIKKIIAIILTAAILTASLPIAVFASENQENTPKEEVVYVNLAADGSVKSIYVVNIFELDKDGKIIDYGRYEALRNMTSTDEISYEDEKVTIDTKAGKLYYEGKLKSNVMPWKIEVKYYMDGTEYSAEEIAGKSGALKISLNISKNPEYTGESDFFAAFALQTSFSLDTEKCQNISAPGATLANVGSNKQITYTVLPNKGASAEITANVKDFAFDGISVNGIRLNLNITIDENMINTKIDELTSAVGQLKDGADALNSGSKELYEGTSLLNDKLGELYNGVGALSGGSSTLADGLAAIVSKNDELVAGALEAFKGICSAAQTMLNAELSKNGFDEITLTPDTYTDVLSELLKKVDADEVYNEAYKQALAIVTENVMKNLDALYSGYIDQNADALYAVYIEKIASILYTQAARQIVIAQLVANGKTQAEAEETANSAEGKVLIASTVSSMTDEQKKQIRDSYLTLLTEEDKAIIKESILEALTDDQKLQIREGYIAELMKSKEVTDQITEIVAKASTAGASIASLKGQLDNYSLFYEGLKAYTSAVSEAANGADTIKLNMATLYDSVGLLKTAVGELNEGTKTLYDGVKMLKEGTDTCASRTSGLKNEVKEIIDNMMASAIGSKIAINSFVSSDNVNVQSVQFVIKTEAVAPEMAPVEPATTEKPKNFWQKLLALFGIKS